MPFSQSILQNIKPYTHQAVAQLNPNQLGVYDICNANEWIYIGKGNLRDRLLEHLNGDIPCINQHKPTGWVACVTADYDSLEKALIVEYQPKCNQRVG